MGVQKEHTQIGLRFVTPLIFEHVLENHLQKGVGTCEVRC